MRDILHEIETPYIDAQALLCFLHEYKKPREWIRRMVNNGELIRVKNGFFLIRSKIQQGSNQIIPFEQVANLLYGPSYVSLEWALSFYGIIPERVYTVTSIALGRSKLYQSSIGNFSYCPLRSVAYSIGIEQKKSADFIGGFLIASPEKALADVVFQSCKDFDKQQLKVELLESRRIEPASLQNLDKNLLVQIADAYESIAVDSLVDIVGRI